MACEDWTEPKKNLCWLKRKSIDADETGHPSDFSLEQMDGRMLSTVELLSFRTIKSRSCYTVSGRGYHRGTHPFANRNAASNALPGHLTASPPLNISSFRCHAAASQRDCLASWSSSFPARIRGSASRSVAGIHVISLEEEAQRW